MYLKKLELYGFKSFANKTEFIFEPGVTAVVGPNGCGKSNISDAIKWVLGEQSAKSLRGLEMRDVIFNGTTEKEPVNFAEVSLTLSNHSKTLPIDYDEVTISRRLFRSGESEYLLNKTVVRLKDISELLMGTGIGVDNYFLMEQGKIDLILSSKPEERRAIFEEASGITKFKSKKRETLNKLEATEANLLRLNDIISEAQRQINSIERQAQKARRYKKHFDRLKTLELSVSRVEYDELDKTRKDMQDIIVKLKAEQSALSTEAGLLFNDVKAVRQELETVDSQMLEIKNDAVATENALFRAKERIQLDNERIHELNVSINGLAENIKSSIAKTEELKSQISQLEKEKESFSSEKLAKENSLKEKQDLLTTLEKSIEEAQNKITGAKSLVLEKTSQYAKIKNEMAKITANSAGALNRLKRLEIEKQSCLASLGQIKEKLSVSESEFTAQKEMFDTLKIEIENTTAEFKKSQGAQDSLNKDYDSVQKEFVSLQSRVELLQDITLKHEGFSDAVKALLDTANKDMPWYGGILGVLADLITGVDAYEQCIESALIDDLETIVVEDVKTAEELVAYLRQNNLGRIKIIILSNLGLKTKTQLTHPSIIGEALNFVKADARYQALFSAVLGNTWIVKDLSSAYEIRQQSNSAKLVTSDGEVVYNDYIIAGKRRQEQVLGLIGRESKLIQAKEQLVLLSARCQSLSAEIEKSKQINLQFIDTIEKLNGHMRQEEIQLVNKQSGCERTAEEFAKLKEELSVVELELDDLSEEIGHLKQQDDTFKQDIVILEKELNEFADLINGNQNWIQANLKEKETALIEVAKTGSELESFNQRYADLENNISVLSESLERETALYHARSRQIEDSKTKIISLQNEIQQLGLEAESLTVKKSNIEKQLNDIAEKRKEISARISEKESGYERMQKGLQDINSRIYSQETEAAQLSFQQQRLQDRISQSYKIDLGSYKLLIQRDVPEAEQLPVDFNIDTARSEIEELRAKLDSIGAVNLDAMGEEKELQERFNTMVSQRDDLLKAKENLMDAISKINKTTKDLFLDTFNKVQVEFRYFFKLLFAGGDTELFLIDEHDVLESGIEIVAKPPGKRLQNISLLSGGEKTMTALALLFAVFKIKPSPFCVMDEMDAPLDEANIDRFSRVLQEFTKNSQFIIITHNKKTIAISDVMYGITMEESGISKVVSVKFGEKKPQKAEEEVAVSV